jgi:ubiquinone/menaquinone biosynthesis C-methylase UbiE
MASIDTVTDAESMGIASRIVDCVYLPALLEHASHPASVIVEVQRVLRPGGLVAVEVPFLIDSPQSHELACGLYYLGRKPLTG